MKIAILDADKLTPSIIKRYGCYADKFIRLLSPAKDKFTSPAHFQRYNIIENQYPESIDKYDAYIITGSQHSCYENLKWIKDLENYIRLLHQNKKKLIGICFGHQIIAQSLGGLVEKNSKGWELGITATHITQPLEWMQPPRDFFFSLVSHQDHVTRLPEQAINFAETNLCCYSGFCIENHILTFQGHPEFSNNYVKLIIKLESKHLSQEQRVSARASLQQKDDHDLIMHWLVNFINS